jgi:uncharacterized protein YcbX
VPTIESLHVYPVKSCRGLRLTQAQLTATGLAYDREWMVVSADGRFLTQREVPRLAQVGTAIDEERLSLGANGAGSVDVALNCRGRAMQVTVWRDRCAAWDQGDAPARWLSEFLGRPVRLVRFDESVPRRSDPRYTGDTPAWAKFSDGFALLAISQASLDLLNTKLPAPLPMNRFRPNLVLGGLEPHGEDRYGDLRGEDGTWLRGVKPCMRCVIPTTDQLSGERTSEEPLRTLREYRWNDELGGITFGQNLIVIAGAGQALREGQSLS